MKNVESSIVVDSIKTSYRISGRAGPVIVLLNGHNTPMSSWDRVIPLIERDGRVFSYDRLGTGTSDAPLSPQDGKVIVSRLVCLLKNLSLPPSYILVAHSLGGLYANLFARLYRDKLHSVVLVESGHPDEANRREQDLGVIGRSIQTLLSLSANSFRKSPFSEYNAIPKTLVQIETAPDFPNCPLTVVTGEKKLLFVPRKSFDKHRELQLELLKLSKNSRQITAKESGHFPQITEPEVVACAILSSMNEKNTIG